MDNKIDFWIWNYPYLDYICIINQSIIQTYKKMIDKTN